MGDLAKIGRGLGLTWPDCVQGKVLERVRETLENAVAEAGVAIESRETLKRVIRVQFSIRVEYIENPDELEDLKAESTDARFQSRIEDAFGDNSNLGLLLPNPDTSKGALEHLAVIDARQPASRARAEFTEWHEYAHVLANYFPGTEIRAGAEPESDGERLMDAIAAELMWYAPRESDGLDDAVAKLEVITFADIEELRQEYHPDASFHSTAIRCVCGFSKPCRLLRLQMGWNARDRAAEVQDKNQELLAFVEPVNRPKQLRAVEVTWPKRGAESSRLEIFANMRVPPESILSTAFDEGRSLHALEDQSLWKTSSGGPLRERRIRVEVSTFGPNVLALIQHADADL